jgi:LmbE family N-acetylglucosaminyl deacetylase
VQPDFLIAIDSVMECKSAMLAEHVSQQAWLDQSQALSAPVEIMRRFGEELAKPVAGCRWAEGWRRHTPLGFCAADANPLRALLADYYFAL